jgi:predicted DNA-binding transcriptional regulator AlpA
MTAELFPKVELWQLSEHAIHTLEEIMRRVLAEQATSPTGAMRAAQAAAYIGVGRSKFYELLRTDPSLRTCSFRAGTARMWRKEDLDAWMQAQVASKQANSCVAP